MRKILGAMFVLVLCALLVWTLTERHGAPLPAAAAVEATRALKPEPPTELSAAQVGPAQSARETAPPAPTTAAALVVDRNAALVDDKCELRGRFSLPGGAPAADVRLRVRGWEANQERVLRYGTPESFDEPTGSSAADGRFSIRFDPPRAYQFVLGGRLSGFCEASWRWGAIEPRQIVDVGDVELVRGGSIRGRIVDSKGRALKNGWSAHADGPRQVGSMDREAVRARSDIDPVSGEFLLEGLPPGGVSLKAYARIANWIEGPTVEVRAGEEVRADILYTGPDNEARIVVVTFCEPFYVFSHEIPGITLRALGFAERKAVKIERSSQSYAFDELPPGAYTVEIHDPRFLPWSKSDVAPGTSINAMLKGNAAVVLRVVDDATEEPIAPFALDVRFDHVNFSPTTFRVVEFKDEPPHAGLVDGLIPHDQTLIVHANGYADCEVPAPGLSANETRPLVARLVRGRVVSGTVRLGGPKRTPAEGADVELSRRDADELPGERRAFGRDDVGALKTKSDAEGKFDFAGVAPGEYTLRAVAGTLLHASIPITVAKRSDTTDVDVFLPATGRLVGKILAPEGASFERLTIRLKAVTNLSDEDRELNAAMMFQRPGVGVPIAADGTFRSTLAPAGDLAVFLQSPEIEIPAGPMGSTTMEGPTIDLGLVTVSPDIDTQREFDLRATFPGPVQVHVRVNGQSAPALVVVLEKLEDSSALASGITDVNGACRLGPVPMDRWRVSVSPTDSSWVYVDARSHGVKPGLMTRLDVEVALYPGAFTLVDAATRQPLALVAATLWPIDGQRGVQTKTDVDGRVRLTLPAGRWRVSSGSFGLRNPEDESNVIEWGPGGASRTEVAVTPRAW